MINWDEIPRKQQMELIKMNSLIEAKDYYNKHEIERYLKTSGLAFAIPAKYRKKNNSIDKKVLLKNENNRQNKLLEKHYQAIDKTKDQNEIDIRMRIISLVKEKFNLRALLIVNENEVLRNKLRTIDREILNLRIKALEQNIKIGAS